jgi:putative ABC transport system ATP-binding protein
VPALEIDDLTVEYRSGDYALRPIDGLSRRVEPGSLVLLLGPSGCGKTTLLSALGGILTPTSGSIRVGDTDVTSLRGAQLTEYRRRTVGMIFQSFNLVPSLTAVENVATPLWAAGVARSEAGDRAVELLERVGMGERLHHRPDDLSGGQQQRVAIARALALDPPLLLADEPTAHLDYIQVEGVIRLIRELADGDRIVIVSTHDDRLNPVADEVIEMVPRFRPGTDAAGRRTLAAGEVLFRQGDASDLIYVVDAGEVDIVREHADGGTELRATLGAGEYFGEFGPMLGLPRSATVVARTDVTLSAYPLSEFRARLGDHGPAALLDHSTPLGPDTSSPPGNS